MIFSMIRAKYSSYQEIVGQLLRYGVVGIISNIVLYGLFLLITSWGVGPKTAMTALYGVGVLQTFAGNRHWSFRYSGPVAGSFARYCAAYGSGYVLNFLLLAVMVDHLNLPYQYVQASAVFLVAAYLFILQRYWVYTHRTNVARPHSIARFGDRGSPTRPLDRPSSGGDCSRPPHGGAHQGAAGGLRGVANRNAQ